MSPQQPMAPEQKRTAIVVFAFVGLLVVFMFSFVAYTAYEERTAHARMKDAFEAHLTDYTSMPQPRAGDLHVMAPRGKMVLVDVRERELDQMHYSCRAAAATPDEVETVVWLRWDEQWTSDPLVFGGYTASGWKCTVSVFDVVDRRLSAQKEFRGGNDSRPESEIYAYLSALQGR